MAILTAPTTRQSVTGVCLVIGCCLFIYALHSHSDKERLYASAHKVQQTVYSFLSPTNNKTTSKPQTEKGGVTEDPQICDSLLESQSYLNKSDFRIQLIAATPGSGSDWCRTTISLLTALPTIGSPSHVVIVAGLKTHEVFDFMHEKNVDKVFKDGKYPIYYKSHYPFIKSHCAGDGYLHDHAERVIVVVRNPLDSAFSEFIRQKMEQRRGRNKDKYSQVEALMVQEDFLKNTTDGQSPSTGFDKYLDNYLELWIKHHQYWLEDYTGELMFVLYDDLVKDINKFLPMVEFFGYDCKANKDRLKRYYCFLENLKKTKAKKRPHVPLIDDSKDKLRSLTSERVDESISYVNSLYYNKFKTVLELH